MLLAWLISCLLWLTPQAPQAQVLFFVATDCPYSNRYFPEMMRLQKEFAGRGVRFTWVYPNRYERIATVETHQRTFGAPEANIALDADGTMTREAGVHITPEAAVLVRAQNGAWTTAYHGRIDDRYVRIGLERPHAEHHDLEKAIEAVLAGQNPLPANGSAVGCTIVTASP